MQPLISVIVPIYKVEKYIRKCIDSIINQTYKNLEIILVDDGSPDDCPEICDEYAEKDSRVKVIHKENGGLSDARNAGMSVATGNYVSFIDSDDYISEDFIENLLSIIIREKSDIVECKVLKVYNYQDEYICEDNLQINTYTTEQGLSLLMSEQEFHQHVWNKLYKSDIALKIPFEKGKLNEDEYWSYQVFGQAQKVTKINKTMYYYLQRSDSIMGNGYSLRHLDALEAKTQRQIYIDKNFPNLSEQAKFDFFNSCIFACQSSMKFLKRKEKKEAKAIIRSYVKKCKLTRNEISTLQGKESFWFSFANSFFMLCCKIRSITGVGF